MSLEIINGDNFSMDNLEEENKVKIGNLAKKSMKLFGISILILTFLGK